jgi:hypothetical protein
MMLREARLRTDLRRTATLIQVKDVFAASRFLCAMEMCLFWRGAVARTTIAYLEQRYLALGEEIANALHRRPTDDLAIADLKYRKLVVAVEIQHNRRLVERVLGKSRAVLY